ncbi:MAG: hypothetical protein EOM44_15455, partial [Bacteroidia bacterium]|nr:hypothetical protein [Bacteroidia bacterium]
MTEGTIVVNSDGTYIFTPAVGYSGPVPPITYTATNASGVTDNANLYLTVVKDVVTGANNPPVANHDVATVKQGSSVTVYPLTNDSDPDGTTPTVTGITALNSTGGTITLTTTPVNVYNANKVLAGTASVDASGNLIFTAASGYTGDVPFTYGITDDGTSTSKATSTINVTVTSTPTPTVDANDDAKTAPQGKGINGNVLTNDITSGITTVTSITINGVNHTISSGSPATVTIPGKGTVIVNSDGTYTFSPLPTFTGTVPVEYTISNGTVTDKATLYLTSLPAVEATDDINQTPSGTPVNGNLLTNDKGLTSVTTISVNGVPTTIPAGGSATLTMTEGTIVVNSD